MVVKGGGDRQVGWGLRGLLIQVKDSREGGQREYISQSTILTFRSLSDLSKSIMRGLQAMLATLNNSFCMALKHKPISDYCEASM